MLSTEFQPRFWVLEIRCLRGSVLVGRGLEGRVLWKNSCLERFALGSCPCAACPPPSAQDRPRPIKYRLFSRMFPFSGLTSKLASCLVS